MHGKGLGIPKAAHIPRPSTDDIANYEVDSEAAGSKWSNDFNQAMGNLTISNADTEGLIESLKKAKTQIESALTVLEKSAQEPETQIYFDIPFPVPDTTKKDLVDENPNFSQSVDGQISQISQISQNLDKNKNGEENGRAKNGMNAWSRERMELLTTIDENSAENSKLYQTVTCLEQEREELLKEAKKAKKKIGELGKELEFAKKKERDLFSAIQAEGSLSVENGNISTNGLCYEKEEKGGWVLEYIGTRKNGKNEGYGHFAKTEKSDHDRESISLMSYDGWWKESLFDGFGVIRSDAQSFKGIFARGKKTGKGVLTSAEGTFDGVWVDDELHGNGTALYQDGSRYEGEWRCGRKCGEGRLVCDSEGYEGEWEDDLFHGKGKWSHNDGSNYFGSFENGSRHGRGVFVHTEGWTYSGDWVRGKKQGEGEMVYQAAGYTGDWRNDCREGRGEYRFSNGDRYAGEWASNLAHGQGRYDFADGARYEGGFERGWPCGQGLFAFPNGNEVRRGWLEHLPTGYRVEIPWQKTMFKG